MRCDGHMGARGAERSVGKRLIAAVEALAGGHAALLGHAQRPWASITFSGARHELRLAFSGEAGIAAGERLIAALPEHEFALAGHLVADAAIAEVEHVLLPEPRLTVKLEVLTLEDC